MVHGDTGLLGTAFVCSSRAPQLSRNTEFVMQTFPLIKLASSIQIASMHNNESRLKIFSVFFLGAQMSFPASKPSDSTKDILYNGPTFATKERNLIGISMRTKFCVLREGPPKRGTLSVWYPRLSEAPMRYPWGTPRQNAAPGRGRAGLPRPESTLKPSLEKSSTQARLTFAKRPPSNALRKSYYCPNISDANNPRLSLFFVSQLVYSTLQISKVEFFYHLLIHLKQLAEGGV